MADLQQHGAQSDAASLGPQPEVYMPVDSVSNGLKRAAPEGDDSEAPEAKQARLDDAAAQGEQTVLEDLLPQPAGVQPAGVQPAGVQPAGLGSDAVASSAQAVTDVAPSVEQSVQAAATPASAVPTAQQPDASHTAIPEVTDALPNSTPEAAPTAVQSDLSAAAVPAAITTPAAAPLSAAAVAPAVAPVVALNAAPVVVPAAEPSAAAPVAAAPTTAPMPAAVPTPAAASTPTAQEQQAPIIVEPKLELQQAGQQQDVQYQGGRGGGRGGRGGRGRGDSRGHGNAEEGQEPTGDASRFKMPSDVMLKQEIPLPRRMASCVIGIKGQTVSKLRRDSGAKIHVRPGVGAAELDQVVEIEGSIEAVVTCIRLVDELVRAEDPNYKMTPKTEVTSRFYVLPEMIGPAIIGKSGTHAKHIRERTGVRIEVIPPADNATRQHIVLHGTAERVREAYHLLLGNIRKYGPSLPAGAIPTPLPFPNRPPSAAERGAAGRGRGGYGGRGTAQPPPPPRASAGNRTYNRYEDYGAAAAAAPYGYAAAAPAAPAYPAPAPAASAYAAPAAGYAAAAPDPNAAALAAAAAGGQQMYILQDGVLKPLTVMYQQPAAAPAAPPAGAAAGQALQGLAGYGAPPAQPAYGAPAAAVAPAAPSSTGAPGGAVLYQQPGGAYTYAAAPAADAAAAQATVAAGGWVGAVQQLATSQPGGAPAYAAAGNAAPAYAQPAAQIPGAPASVQYVQYAYQQQ